LTDPARPAQTRPRQLQFDRYVLDLDRGCLLLDGSEIALRPKTFAVLNHLVENAGRLVSKEELFAAVWPSLVVTDDVLVQSVGELRRMLGDDGAHLIKTIPRRGYRFEGNVSMVPAIAATAADPAPHPPPVPEVDRASRRFGWRGGLLAFIALVVLLGAGVWWSGLGTDLLTARKPEIGARAAIAVLPFSNQGNDPSREYFADGLTQDVINALGRFPELTVMSWNAVSPYKDKPASPAEIARSLAVQYQVEGSVLQTGDRVRVIAQLVNTDGRVLWSARFKGC